jgi:hypothetical protein
MIIDISCFCLYSRVVILLHYCALYTDIDAGIPISLMRFLVADHEGATGFDLLIAVGHLSMNMDFCTEFGDTSLLF